MTSIEVVDKRRGIADVWSPFLLLPVLFLAICTAATELNAQTENHTRFLRQHDHQDDGLRFSVRTIVRSAGETNAELEGRFLPTSRTNNELVILVETVDSLSQSGFESYRRLRTQHPEIVVIPALQLKWGDGPPWKSLQLIVSDSPSDLQLLEQLAQHFSLVNNEPLQIEQVLEALEWCRDQLHGEEAQPLLLYSPQAWSGESAAELVQEILKLKRAFGTVTGLPILTDTLLQQDINQALGASRSQVREAAIEELATVHDLSLLSAFRFVDSSGSSSSEAKTTTWVEVHQNDSTGGLAAFRTGRFFVAQQGLANSIELSVDALGLERPASVGEELFVPTGDQIQIELQCDIPELNSTGEPNWADSLQIVVVSHQGTERLADEQIQVGESTGRWQLEVPAGGVTIWGQVTRTLTDGQEIVALTNPVRVNSPRLTASEVLQATEVPFPWISFLAGLVGVMAIAVGVRVFRGRRYSPVYRNLRPSRKVATPKQEPKSQPTVASPQPRVDQPPESRLDDLDENVDWQPSDASETVSDEPSFKPIATDFPRRHQIGVLAFLATAFIVYGLFVPLRYREISIDAALEQFSNIRYLSIGVNGRQDWVANILIFVPLGYLWCSSLILDRRRVFSVRLIAFLLVSVLLTGLAIGTEFLQLWFPPRTVSQNDIIAETLGGVIGSLLAVFTVQGIVNWTRAKIGRADKDSILDWCLSAYLLGLLIVMLMPFDFVVNADELQQKVDAGRISIGLSDFAKEDLAAYAVTVLMFVPVGIWAYRKLSLQADWGVWSSRLAGVLIVAFYEILQVPVFSRNASLTSFIAGSLGVLLGDLLYENLNHFVTNVLAIAPQANRKRRDLDLFLIALFLGVVGCLHIGEMSTETNGETMHRLAQFWQVPFARLYWGSELNAFFVILRHMLVMLPFGFILADVAIVAGQPDRLLRRLVLAAVTLSVVACLLEVGQAWSVDHYCDITDSITMSLGGMAGIALRMLIVDFSSTQRTSEYFLPRYATLGKLTFLSLIAAAGVVVTGMTSFRVVHAATSHLLKAENRINLVVNDLASSDHLQVENIIVPTMEYSEAIWGATGTDQSGSIWVGVSDGRHDQPSARILRLRPEQGRFDEVNNALSLLRSENKLRTGEGQSKVHSKFIQADDGLVYFSSMDEKGEASDGSQLPIWGSHLWRVDPRSDRFEHLAAVPEGLIAVSGSGNWIYALGLFDHVLYQYNVSTNELNSVRVGAIGGHISRNFMTDQRGHAFVPRLSYFGPPAKLPKNPLQKSEDVKVELVEFDTNLREIGSTPIEHYLTNSYWSSHGITGITRMTNGTVVFTTAAGYLYRILPGQNEQPGIVQSLGSFHPEGGSYAPSLFQLGDDLVGGIVERDSSFEWVEYNLASYHSRKYEFPIPKIVGGGNGLLLYGSQSQDAFGGSYVVGKIHGTPIMLRVSRKR